jgi:hypothetical protein
LARCIGSRRAPAERMRRCRASRPQFSSRYYSCLLRFPSGNSMKQPKPIAARSSLRASCTTIPEITCCQTRYPSDYRQ